MVAAIIEMARTLAAKPAPDRIIVLHSHATTKCNARTVDWFRSTSYRGIDDPWWVCVRSVHRAFIGDASPLRQGDTRAQDPPRMEVLLGAAHMHSEHAN
jgi:hypothetical protein